MYVNWKVGALYVSVSWKVGALRLWTDRWSQYNYVYANWKVVYYVYVNQKMGVLHLLELKGGSIMSMWTERCVHYFHVHWKEGMYMNFVLRLKTLYCVKVKCENIESNIACETEIQI